MSKSDFGTTEWPAGERERRIRRIKMLNLLEAFDLTIDDFVLWLREECGITSKGSDDEPT